MKTRIQTKPAQSRSTSHRQRGASIENFLFWMVLASIVSIGLVAGYNKANSFLDRYLTKKDVVSIKSATEDWAMGRTDLTGVSIGELCKQGNGNEGEAFCGSKKDGKNANRYGGDYTLKVSKNVSQIDVGITGIDVEYVNAQANSLAGTSADNCQSVNGCATIASAGTTVTVTM